MVVLTLSVFTSYAQINTFPNVTDFEAQALCPTGCGPTCALDTDWKNGDQLGFPADINWTADTGGTSSSATGPSVDHTTGTATGVYIYAETSCSGTGYPNSTFDLYSPQYDFTNLTNPVLIFWYHLFGNTSGNMQVDVSTDNWVSSTPLVAPFTDNVDEWQRSVAVLSAYAGMSDVRLRIRYTSGTSFTGDAALDDIQVADASNPNLELTEVSLDNPACTLTDAETVQYEITNAGFLDIPAGTNYDVSVSINGITQGTTTHTLSAPLLIGSSIIETFSLPVDLAVAGDYAITATLTIADDTNVLDDTASVDITSAGEISLPYFQDFESGAGGWEAINIANSSWELGTPANPIINSAVSGDNAWITNANGDYNSNENGYVQSPCFDLSETCGDPEMTVSVWWNAENSWDGMVVQSSIDAGDSWQNIGAFQEPDPNPENNWYTDNTIDGGPGGQQEGWTGREGTNNGSGAWVTAAQELTGLGGNSNVVIRFAFASDGSVQDDGVAFDDFAITNNRAVAITDISATGESCAGAEDGTATVNATTECGNLLLYSSDGGDTYQTSNVLTGLAPGETTILVKSDVSNYVVSQTVTINPGVSCELEIVDPCSCLNNASVYNQDTGTGGDDGGFSETVSITGLGGAALPTGLTFSVTGATGVLDAGNVPAEGIPQAGVPVLTDGSVGLSYDAGTGHYSLDFVHLDDIGYSLTVEGPNAVGSAGNITLTIGNKCAYPNASISSNGVVLANDEICPNEDAFFLDVLSDELPEGLNFTINGVGSLGEFNPSTLGVGSHVILLTFDAAADANGGISPDGGTTAAKPGCIQTVMKTVVVDDNVNPVALCQNVSIQLDENGAASTTATDVDNNSNDNCGLAGVSLDITDFDCSNLGDNDVVLTATDLSGNEHTCNATVTVLDEIPAQIECRQPISTTMTPGVCGKNDLVVLPPFSIYDNCGAGNITFTRIPAGNDFPLGTTTLNWTGTDFSGNTSTCQSLVIVEDNEAPTVASCNSVIDFVDLNSCFAQVTVITDVFDNCGIASIEGTGTFTLAFGSYPNPITVTDVNGNATVHDFTIYIHDDFAPEFQNCPEETIVLQAGAAGTANYPAQTPVATDNCGVPTITNDLPEGGLPMGDNVVTFIAEDAYGNTSECIVNVEVSGGISLHPVSDIESSLAENETAQTIAWNALNAGTICELCEETELEGFRYVGTWWGHQYFLANESSLTREEANLIAEGYDAHLAVINDELENAYLTEALDEEIRSAWIGLMPISVDEEWTFTWDNGDAVEFEAIAFDEVDADTRIILGNDGTWKAATIEEDKFFLIERPCVDFTQTGPIYVPEVEADEEEIPGVLLRSGDVWPEGEYEVTYALTDMCGNEAVMNFDVDVLTQLAEYCTTQGVNNSVWVEKFVFHDLLNESESNEGYADFTEETTMMNIGDGVVLVRLEAGGNEAEDMLYWNIYMDANADGDFYDAGEMLYQVASREDVETNLSLPLVSIENARLRVMVSRYAFAAPCGDTYVGEIEDYNLHLLLPEDYARAACDVDVAGLNGERNGFTVDLDWTVNSACPIENYTVEYSTDGVNFIAVTQIEENDFSDLIYTKSHTTTLPSIIGAVIYRIKIETANQPAFYTNPVSFRMNGKPNAPILYPNPADTYVSVALGEYVGQTGSIIIYDNLGKVRLIQEFDETTGDTMILNLQKFTDGIFHVSIEADGKRIQTQRLVINKLYGWSPAR